MADAASSLSGTLDHDRFAADVETATKGLQAVQRLQAAYDEVGWRIKEPTWAKARHMLYHLLASTAELAALVESVEHAEESGSVVTSAEFNAKLEQHALLAAEYVLHGAQIAEMAGADLGELVVAVWGRNARTFAPDSAFAELGKSTQ
jgi:hypothetical protein